MLLHLSHYKNTQRDTDTDADNARPTDRDTLDSGEALIYEMVTSVMGRKVPESPPSWEDAPSRHSSTRSLYFSRSDSASRATEMEPGCPGRNSQNTNSKYPATPKEL